MHQQHIDTAPAATIRCHLVRERQPVFLKFCQYSHSLRKILLSDVGWQLDRSFATESLSSDNNTHSSATTVQLHLVGD